MKKDNKINKREEEVNNLKNQLARALADYDNLNKRTLVERQNLSQISSLRIVIKLLPILDMLEDAQKHLADAGLAISTGEFKRILQEEGLEEIIPKIGDKFDENLEEVVEALEGGIEGKIAEVVLTGWKFKEGLVVRHAKVKVYLGLTHKKGKVSLTN
ncbi:MAG: nucleotide exchange factor GrpE [Patescibacteria group bacterium]